jgi:F-type H+-transporting ATPase subunit delta
MAELATIARPYAEAVFGLGRDNGNLGAWSEMLALLEMVVVDGRVADCIGDPNVTGQQLEGLILGVAGDRLDGAGRNLISVLVHNGRLPLVPEIRVQYEALRREHEGVLEAEIESGQPLADEQLAQLVTHLEARYKRKVRARVKVDPDLIGGVRIVLGDKVIDATVRGKLNAMAAALTH